MRTLMLVSAVVLARASPMAAEWTAGPDGVPVDYYALEQKYWRSFWHEPPTPQARLSSPR